MRTGEGKVLEALYIELCKDEVWGIADQLVASIREQLVRIGFTENQWNPDHGAVLQQMIDGFFEQKEFRLGGAIVFIRDNLQDVLKQHEEA